MEGFCRGCLVKYDELMDLLQYTERNRRLFVYSTGLQVKRNDTFTFQICKDCYLNMKIACKFKKQCRASDKLFKNYMALKESGENIDFQRFLKTHDESLTFRLPMLSGNLTPSNQRIKEEDNESTTTSIRNFMTDILHDEEIPVTEARIIQEVIEEEADVLDDSLDSHWLQDDVSIDTDFKLDFSFSPFSSPKWTNGQYTPKQTNQRTQEQQYVHNYHNLKQFEQHVDNYNNYMSVKTEINETAANQIAEDTMLMDTKCNIALEDDNKEWHYYANSEQVVKIEQPSQYVSDTTETLKSVDKVLDTEDPLLIKTECSIDRNLKIALKDENNKEFAVEDLICSPPVYARVSSPTPSISKILFGDKNASSDVNKAMNKTPEKGIHNYHSENGDIGLIEEFLAREKADKLKSQLLDKEVIIDDEGNETFKKPQSPIQNKYDEETLHCKICDKTFRELKYLRTHFVKVHKVSIGRKPRKDLSKRHCICPVCGKEYNDLRNYHRHVKKHKQYKCPICSLEYATNGYLKNHMKTHGDGANVILNKQPAKPKEKRYLCNHCGSNFAYKHNYWVHLQRHNKIYEYQCHDCSKQFFRKTELIRHIRVHTNEKPYTCKLCPKSFSRSDRLSQHMKYHTDEKQFECSYCSLRFVAAYGLRMHMKTSKRCLKLRSTGITEGTTEQEFDFTSMATENGHVRSNIRPIKKPPQKRKKKLSQAKKNKKIKKN